MSQYRPRRVRERVAGEHACDAGLSLLETMVALFVIGVGLMALLPLQIRSAQTVASALERQRATAQTTRALEQVRDACVSTARAAVIVTGGPAYPADPAVTNWPIPAGETLLTSASPDASLAQIGPTPTTPSFTTRLYVTQRSGDPAGALWITAVTSWRSTNASSAAQSVVIRSLFHARTS